MLSPAPCPVSLKGAKSLAFRGQVEVGLLLNRRKALGLRGLLGKRRVRVDLGCLGLLLLVEAKDGRIISNNFISAHRSRGLPATPEIFVLLSKAHLLFRASSEHPVLLHQTLRSSVGHRGPA